MKLGRKTTVNYRESGGNENTLCMDIFSTSPPWVCICKGHKNGKIPLEIEDNILTEKHQGYEYEHCYSYT